MTTATASEETAPLDRHAVHGGVRTLELRLSGDGAPIVLLHGFRVWAQSS